MTGQLSTLKLSADYSQYRNVWFCACGRRLLRGEFLVRDGKGLVVKQGVKQCHYCERGLD